MRTGGNGIESISSTHSGVNAWRKGGQRTNLNLQKLEKGGRRFKSWDQVTVCWGYLGERGVKGEGMPTGIYLSFHGHRQDIEKKSEFSQGSRSWQSLGRGGGETIAKKPLSGLIPERRVGKEK